jgi:N-acetylglucosamine-6-sulfatase
VTAGARKSRSRKTTYARDARYARHCRQPDRKGSVLIGLLLVIVVIPSGCGQHGDHAAAAHPTGPNIIVIVTDDQAPGSLGVAGNANVRTPHLDALAAGGVYFTRAYVPIPQCAPSRAAMLTGQYPHVAGVMTNTNARLPGDTRTLPRVLKEHGYATGLIGKWHLGADERAQGGFEDMWVTFPVKEPHTDPELWVDGERRRHEGFLTDILTDYAIRFVDRYESQPFFLWLAYRAPHPPFPREGGERFAYDAAALPLPASINDDLSAKPAAQRDSTCHEWFAKAGRNNGARLRRRLSKYYALVSGIDYNVGRLVEHLRGKGIADRTVLFYLSDNGALFGEHQMVTKGPALYEELVRTPLIVWAPGRLRGGRRVDALVSALDIFPTACSLTGSPPPPGLAGTDIWPLAAGDGPIAPRREALFLQYEEKTRTGERVPIRGLVTDRYKYAVYLDSGEEELYDLRSDPGEMTNLAAGGGHRDVVAVMRKRLDDWRHRSGDVGS